MERVIDLLAEQPLLLLFVVAALGYAIGEIKIKGTGLGVAAVLFVGLAFGALDERLTLPPALVSLGLVLFVYMVGLASGGPNAPALLRKAARLADRLNAPWYAVYIQTPAEDLSKIDAATQRVLGKNLELAQQLGGIPMTFKGPDVASTIGAFAREYGIKVIVVGRTRQPWYRRLLGGSILVETVFSWPGTGLLLNNAIFQRDLPVLQGTILVLAMFFVTLNLVVDLVQTALGPRIKRA